MSIVRVGLGETAKFAEGYEAIFGKKKTRKEDGRVSGRNKSSKRRVASARKKKPRKK